MSAAAGRTGALRRRASNPPEHGSGKFSRRCRAGIDTQVIAHIVPMNSPQVTTSQPPLIAPRDLPLLGHFQRTPHSHNQRIEARQRRHPQRHQFRTEQHLVDNDVVPTMRERGSRRTARTQHPQTRRPIPNHHQRMPIHIMLGPVIPESIATERTVQSPTPFRRHHREERVDPPVQKRTLALILDRPRQRRLPRTRRPVEKDHPPGQALPHQPRLPPLGPTDHGLGLGLGPGGFEEVVEAGGGWG